MRRLTLYGRAYCHLCDEMRQALGALQGRMGFQLDYVDVDDDPGIEAHYGERVPALVGDGEEICHHRLDMAALRAYFSRP